MAQNLAQSTYLSWLASEDTNRQKQVLAYRSYYEGDPPTYLTDRQAQFLNVDREKNFGANVCAVIVDSAVERMEVTGFEVRPDSPLADTPSADMGANGNGQAPPASREEQLAALLDTWWSRNRMDAKQDHVHRAALRDGEGFIIVGYDADDARPTYDYNFAYDGKSGVKVHYQPDSFTKLAFASKRWVVDSGPGGQVIRRLNLYFPNRIEKWVSRTSAKSQYNEAFWQPHENEDDPTLQTVVITDGQGREYTASVSWWTDDGTESGDPLGVPVVPFINRDDGTGRGMSEIDNSMPMQDALNKILIDIIAAGDMTGWQMLWTNGRLPDNFKVYPGAMLPVAPAEGAGEGETPQIGVITPGDPQGLINSGNWVLALLSGISSTPQSRFTPSAVRPAEGTQKQEEGALVAKVEGLHKSFGNAWEDVQRMGLKVASAFGSQALPDADGLTISTIWADAQVRNEREHVEALGMKVEKLNVPREQAWKEAGYSADNIRAMKDMKEQESAERVEEAAVMDQGRQASALETVGRLLGGGNGGRMTIEPPMAASKV